MRPAGATTRRRRQRAGQVGASVLAAAALGLCACGSSAQDRPRILDTEKVERAIERSSWSQRGRLPRVSCPAGVEQREGVVFACTATVAGEVTRFVVTELDGDGRVHYEAR